MVSSGVIPLSVLCACLLIGGIASIVFTRRIATMRAVQEMENTAQAQQEAERIEREKPQLVDVYIAQPKRDLVLTHDKLPWPDVQVRTSLTEVVMIYLYEGHDTARYARTVYDS